jgi:hypothetical protein
MYGDQYRLALLEKLIEPGLIERIAQRECGRAGQHE